MIKFPALAAAALVAISAVHIRAHAEDRDVRNVNVGYGDLNLRSPAGVAALRHRLSAASRNVCGENDGRDLSVTADMLACRQASLARAMADMRQVLASAQTQHSTALASIAPN